MRKGLLLFAVFSVVAITATQALGAGYGRGTFTGTTKPEFDQNDPRTPIKVQVKGARVRVVETAFTFDCSKDGTVLKRTVSTPFTRVKSGPAGGGASFNGKVTPAEGGDPVDVSFSFGLRSKTVSGTADATMDIDGLPCMSSRSFKAGKR